MNYKDYNDYELITYAVSDQSEEALEIIYEKYRPIIINFAKKMLPYAKQGGLELNDLIQEGMIGLNSAINNFTEQRNVTFYTFAKTCIERKIISALVSTRRLKHKILNESVSFELKGDDDEIVYADFLLKDETNDPENLLLNDEREKILINCIQGELTDFELQVFELKLNHFSYDEIANILDKNKKAVDNALQRIKGKIKEILKEIE